MALPLNASRIAVTGAGGFIGRRVLHALEEAGAKPVPIVGPGMALLEGALQGDLTDLDFVTHAFRGVNGLIHLAARSGGVGIQNDAGIYDTNRQITSTVFEAAASQGVGRVFAASSAVLYQQSEQPLIESDPVLPPDEASSYARSKMADEQDGISRTVTGELDVVFGRFGNVIGPLLPGVPPRTTVVYDLIGKALTGQIEVWGDGSAVRSFVHVDDVADAIVKIWEVGAPGEAYNIDSSSPVTMTELATTIRDLVAPDATLTFNPDKPTGPSYRVLSSDKLRRLGFAPQYTWQQSLSETIDGMTP